MSLSLAGVNSRVGQAVNGETESFSDRRGWRPLPIVVPTGYSIERGRQPRF